MRRRREERGNKTQVGGCKGLCRVFHEGLDENKTQKYHWKKGCSKSSKKRNIYLDQLDLVISGEHLFWAIFLPESGNKQEMLKSVPFSDVGDFAIKMCVLK